MRKTESLLNKENEVVITEFLLSIKEKVPSITEKTPSTTKKMKTAVFLSILKGQCFYIRQKKVSS